MKYNPQIHHRRSIRLKGYDYSSAGAYFVTICAFQRECLFGEIEDGGMALNPAGEIIRKIWMEIPLFYSGIMLDEFLTMPNHIHGIIVIIETDTVGAGPCACPRTSAESTESGQLQPGRTQKGQSQGIAPTKTLSIPEVIHRFKSLTTRKYINGVKENNWQPFNKRLWQRNYYEHIIRNEEELNASREYIVNNPIKWELDKENPKNFRDI